MFFIPWNLSFVIFVSVEEREQQATAESYTTTIITNAILRQIMFGWLDYDGLNDTYHAWEK